MRFVVTIPIHMGAMKVRRKVRRGNSFSSETTAISAGTDSGTHPIRFLDKPSDKDEYGDIHTTEIKQNIQEFNLSVIFARKTTKTALKNELNIDLGNILFVYLRDVKWNDPDKKSVKIDRNSQLESFSEEVK